MGKMRWSLPVACAALGACNMVISENPMFAAGDAASVIPRDGIWLAEDEECNFDPAPAETSWPRCAVWVVVRNSARELQLSDGKGQSERIDSLFAAGEPVIIEARWTDSASETRRVTYGYFAVQPQQAQSDGRFVRASLWPVECGIQANKEAEIRPFPGISPECRPGSKDAIRAAAVSSRRGEQVKSWRWLREEGALPQPTISSGLKK